MRLPTRLYLWPSEPYLWHYLDLISIQQIICYSQLRNS